MHVTGANVQWGCFIAATVKRGEQCILFNPMKRLGLSSPVKQVGKSSTPCQKRAKFRIQKVNGAQDICNRDTSVCWEEF